MSVFREIYSQTSRFVYHENEILIDMHCPKSFVGIGIFLLGFFRGRGGGGGSEASVFDNFTM